MLLFIPYFVYSQEYFLLDSLKTRFRVNEYMLDTQEIYNIKKNINVYNVFVSKNSILLISVLPDLNEKILPGMDERGQNWELIDYEKIKNKFFSKRKLQNMLQDWLINNSPDKKTIQYKLVKKQNENYYVSKMCLTEFFSISDLKFPLVSSYGTINIAEQKVTIQEMAENFKQQFPEKNFIMDVRNGILNKQLDALYSFRNYLSKEYTIKGNKAYQFWTFDGWWTHDGYNEHRGIDRFLYIPDKGIVGGSYDFYFMLKPKTSSNDYFTVSTSKLWDNIMNEKIMVAKELN
ncbi:hypothetical protein EG347_12675 [Chryseobacterium sp. G0186]|nr:hypothetical protein EG347_12675 [Chryseobacterium sp. G0186]